MVKKNRKILAFIFLLPVAMATKMAKKNRLKKEKLLFWAKFEDLETEFLRIRYQHKQIPNKTFNILCALIILIIC